MMVRKFMSQCRRRSRAAQTLVEYSLMISLISLVAISALEELGVHVKGSMATADCSLIWAQHNISGNSTTEINAAWTEINTMLNNTFTSSSPDQKMKAKVLAQQLILKNKFLGTTGG